MKIFLLGLGSRASSISVKECSERGNYYLAMERFAAKLVYEMLKNGQVAGGRSLASRCLDSSSKEWVREFCDKHGKFVWIASRSRHDVRGY